jgi:hypothetical protein
MLLLIAVCDWVWPALSIQPQSNKGCVVNISLKNEHIFDLISLSKSWEPGAGHRILSEQIRIYMYFNSET